MPARTVGVTFAIYQQQDGGAPIWLETQNVTTDSTGRYSVLLGSTRNEGVPAELFDTQEQRWLGVQVQGQPEQARVLLVSVPYAFKAHEAEMLSGHEASEFITTDSLRNAVQQLQQATPASSGTLSYTPNSNGVLGQPATTDGATNFVDTTTNQVVLVQQNGTGVALNATAGGNSAVTGKSTTGAMAAVAGTSSSLTGTGLSGIASAATGANFGVKGQSSSTTGTGVSATASATSGATVGLKAQVSSAGGIAAIVQNTASGKLISARTGTGVGTEKFGVDGSGNITNARGVTSTGNLSGQQLISRVATGTAPLQVTSTTQVTNLNASLLGGNTAGAFAPAVGSTSYIQNNTTTQAGGNFNISGNGNVGKTLSGNVVNSATTYQMGGETVLSSPDRLSVYVGFESGTNNTGQDNTFVGFEAGQHTTASTGSTFIGAAAGASTTTGWGTFVGSFAGENNTTGFNNTFLGQYAGSSNTTGQNNVFIGDGAGIQNTTGSNNIYLGSVGSVSGQESNTMRFGDPRSQTATFIAGIRGSVVGSDGISVYVDSNGQLGTTVSSRRFKEQIRDMGDGSSALMKLRPVTFLYKAEYDKGQRTLQYGLIAEEVAELYPDLVTYDPDGKPYTVKYQYLTTMLLNEMQKQYHRAEAEAEVITQQEDKIEAQQQQINSLRKQNEEVQQRLLRLEALTANTLSARVQ
jgi:hypothetical protein